MEQGELTLDDFQWNSENFGCLEDFLSPHLLNGSLDDLNQSDSTYPLQVNSLSENIRENLNINNESNSLTTNLQNPQFRVNNLTNSNTNPQSSYTNSGNRSSSENARHYFPTRLYSSLDVHLLPQSDNVSAENDAITNDSWTDYTYQMSVNNSESAQEHHNVPSSEFNLPTLPSYSSTSDTEEGELLDCFPKVLNLVKCPSVIYDDLDDSRTKNEYIENENHENENQTESLQLFSHENFKDCVLSLENCDVPNLICANDETPLTSEITNAPSSSPVLAFKTKNDPLSPSRIQRRRLAVKHEHNYSEKFDSETHGFMSGNDGGKKTKISSVRKPLSVTQQKQLSSSCLKSNSYTRAEKSSSLPHVITSTKVKSKLQNVLKEKRQTKGRVGRPPKTENSFQSHYSARESYIEKMSVDYEFTLGLEKVASSVNVPVLSRKRRTIAGDPNDDLERRTNHNTMERSRRNSMKLLFQALHRHVPSISGNQKASKASILKESRDYIQELKKEEMLMMKEKCSLEMKIANLKKKIYALNNQRFS